MITNEKNDNTSSGFTQTETPDSDAVMERPASRSVTARPDHLNCWVLQIKLS